MPPEAAATAGPGPSPRGRVAVCVSGRGSNLRALVERAERGSLGADVVLVLADRTCPALDWAAARGLPTALVEPAAHPDRAAWDGALAAALTAARPDVVVLAGFMRWVGPAVLAAFDGLILNVHPSLLPAFAGRHAVGDALAAGVAVTGVTVHLVDETEDGGPIVLQEPVAVLPADDEAALAARLHAVEHRLLPHAVRLSLAGALRPPVVAGERRAVIDPAAATSIPSPRRALLSVSDKQGLADFARGLDGLGFELVSTGGTARAMREAGLDVTDVSAVTGFPEMLDGRVKTLHPRVHAGVLADRRLPDHRAQLAALAIEPFELVVVNLYPFEAAAARPDTGLDALIEEIDIGGPSLVRAAAKNHAWVGVVTDPEQYGAVLGELRAGGGLSEATRRELALAAFATTAAYDGLIAQELAARWWPDRAAEPPAPGSEQPFPARLRMEAERALELRYGENPHQQAALYVLPGTHPEAGPFASGAEPRQGKPLSYNNILDAAAAAGLARDLRGPACVIVKHTNPCGVAERDHLLAAWQAALAGDPVSAFGGVVALTRPIDVAVAEALASIFLEVVLAPGVEPDAEPILGRRENLRLLVDAGLGRPPMAGIEVRSAGGGLLATEADVAPDDPASWRLVTTRSPTDPERRDLDLAWRVARHVKSNAIVLVRDGAVVGVGAGQMSRVDSARLAVAKAGPERARGAACASDAFYPFPDGVTVCTDAGVTAFVQPGGSQRDAEVIAAAEQAGAAMLLTGVRHFRH